MGYCKDTRLVVERESPIPNGLTTVAVKKRSVVLTSSTIELETYVGQRLDFEIDKLDMLSAIMSFCQLGNLKGTKMMAFVKFDYK